LRREERLLKDCVVQRWIKGPAVACLPCPIQVFPDGASSDVAALSDLLIGVTVLKLEPENFSDFAHG
jgi:hypothetical protein